MELCIALGSVVGLASMARRVILLWTIFGISPSDSEAARMRKVESVLDYFRAQIYHLDGKIHDAKRLGHERGVMYHAERKEFYLEVFERGYELAKSCGLRFYEEGAK